jgi:hypothetical protein
VNRRTRFGGWFYSVYNASPSQRTLEWLKLTIAPRASYPNGPDAFGPSSWTRQIQPQP